MKYFSHLLGLLLFPIIATTFDINYNFATVEKASDILSITHKMNI